MTYEFDNLEDNVCDTTTWKLCDSSNCDQYFVLSRDVSSRCKFMCEDCEYFFSTTNDGSAVLPLDLSTFA